jgi:hypothetical protein
VFLRLPFGVSPNVQQTILLVNTIILIAALIVAELAYSETTPRKRRHLKYFYPLFIVLVGLLIYAGYKQVGKA